MPADLSRMAVMTTAWRRPYYFERVLGSWSRAEGQDQLAGAGDDGEGQFGRRHF